MGQWPPRNSTSHCLLKWWHTEWNGNSGWVVLFVYLFCSVLITRQFGVTELSPQQCPCLCVFVCLVCVCGCVWECQNFSREADQLFSALLVRDCLSAWKQKDPLCLQPRAPPLVHTLNLISRFPPQQRGWRKQNKADGRKFFRLKPRGRAANNPFTARMISLLLLVQQKLSRWRSGGTAQVSWELCDCWIDDRGSF